MRKAEKDIIWLGDSLDVLQAFPKTIRADLGGDLRRLQIGEMPLDAKPMKTVGAGARSQQPVSDDVRGKKGHGHCGAALFHQEKQGHLENGYQNGEGTAQGVRSRVRK